MPLYRANKQKDMRMMPPPPPTLRPLPLLFFTVFAMTTSLHAAAFLLPATSSSSLSSSSLSSSSSLAASPYNYPPPPPSGRRRRTSKWINPEIIKQKEMEKRQGKQAGGSSSFSPLDPAKKIEGKEKDRILGQAREQLQNEVEMLIGRLSSIHDQVKDQSNKIITFGVAEFNPKVASLTDDIGRELESLLGRLQELRTVLQDKDQAADLVSQSFALKALSKDLEHLLQLIEAREAEVDVLLKSLGMDDDEGNLPGPQL